MDLLLYLAMAFLVAYGGYRALKAVFDDNSRRKILDEFTAMVKPLKDDKPDGE